MEIKEAADKIRDAVRKVKAMGWAVLPGITCDPEEQCCCPLGAVSVVDNLNAKWLATVAAHLNIASLDAKAFALGFDNNPEVTAAGWYGLGAQIRAELDAGKL